MPAQMPPPWLMTCLPGRSLTLMTMRSRPGAMPSCNVPRISTRKARGVSPVVTVQPVPTMPAWMPDSASNEGQVPGASVTTADGSATCADRLLVAPTGIAPVVAVIIRATTSPAPMRPRPAGIPPYLRWKSPQTAHPSAGSSGRL